MEEMQTLQWLLFGCVVVMVGITIYIVKRVREARRKKKEEGSEY